MSDNAPAVESSTPPAEVSGFHQPAPAPEPVEPAPAEPATPAEPAATPAAAAPAPAEQKPIDYVAALADARAEAAKNRIAARDAKNAADTAAQKAAEEAAAKVRDEITQSFAEALGIAKKDEPVDPETLIAEATAKAQQSDTAATQRAREARAAKVELALYKAADRAGADASALVDSRTFLDSVADLDPTAADFNSQVEDAVKAAVDTSARFRRVTRPADRSRPDAPAIGDTTHPDGDTSVKALIARRRKRLGISL